MANQVFVGIDPGKSGGVSLIKIVEGEISAESYPMEAVELPRLMADLIEDERTYAVIACVEKVGARPGQGVTSMFNFGQGFGYIQGVLSPFSLPSLIISTISLYTSEDGGATALLFFPITLRSQSNIAHVLV